jgi:ring-1,2-phenylacetyl-CoA epoxidase subunit PaaE
MDLSFHPLRVARVVPDTDEAVLVYFDVPEELAEVFHFIPGQFLTLRATIDGADLRRSYSICAGPDEGALRVGVRKVPGGVFSTWINEQLRPGDELQVMPPDGNFRLPFPGGVGVPAPTGKHYLGIAGGSGITPIISIMRQVLAHDPASRFTLVYANRTLRSMMFREELEDLKDRYLTRLTLHNVFSREHTDAPLYSGRMTREKLGEFFTTGVIDPARIDEAFVCGPYAVNDEAETALLAAGMPEERIHIERFGVPDEGGPRHAALEGDAPEARIEIIRDGMSRTVEFRQGDPSILEAARRAGMEMPFSCTSGVCSTCRARLLSGEVRMDRNFALEKHEVAAGFVLTCQAHPLTEEVTLSFDDR